MTEQNQQTLPEWADSGFALDTDDMDPDYLRAETTWRNQAHRFYEAEKALRAKVRRSIDLDDEQRMVVYMVEYERIQGQFQRSADQFTNTWLQRRRDAYNKVNRNATDSFRSSLLSAAALPDDALEGTLNIAQKSGQRDLAQAVAQVVLERQNFALFERWGRENPDKAQALQSLRRVPGFNQLDQRIHKAMKPRKVEDLAQLRPGASEYEEARQREQQSQMNVRLRDFFGGPQVRRVVGRRVR